MFHDIEGHNEYRLALEKQYRNPAHEIEVRKILAGEIHVNPAMVRDDAFAIGKKDQNECGALTYANARFCAVCDCVRQRPLPAKWRDAE